MSFSWASQTHIAAALQKTYPDANRLALDHDGLINLILSLPGFDGEPVRPRGAYLDHILWTWMRLAEINATSEGQA